MFHWGIIVGLEEDRQKISGDKDNGPYPRGYESDARICQRSLNCMYKSHAFHSKNIVL